MGLLWDSYGTPARFRAVTSLWDSNLPLPAHMRIRSPAHYRPPKSVDVLYVYEHEITPPLRCGDEIAA